VIIGSVVPTIILPFDVGYFTMRKDDFYVVIKFVRTVIGNNCKVVMCLDDIMILLPFLLPFVLQNSLIILLFSLSFSVLEFLD
jgi:hypothetical protein